MPALTLLQVPQAARQVRLLLLRTRAEAGLMPMKRSFSFFLPFFGDNRQKWQFIHVKKLLH
jgi:hypothetical protein